MKMELLNCRFYLIEGSSLSILETIDRWNLFIQLIIYINLILIIMLRNTFFIILLLTGSFLAQA